MVSDQLVAAGLPALPSGATTNYSIQFTATIINATEVGVDAFRYCISLMSVNSSTVEIIGGYAFSNCPALESVSFPHTTSIGTSAFYYCPALSLLSIGTDLTTPTTVTIGSSVFNGVSTTNVDLTLGDDVYPAPVGNT